ncbi:hypothetical protein QBC43DRAFT_325713 [Cladorrhinum sp. PSN259]|nr:hypothetical protein QBC43DRAFT_325713 [Cladorrhinum sp. PSN259]
MSSAYALPGAYPGSVPATPDETPIQEPQSHQIHNKLHKPQDPRGHAPADSGVGLTDTEPVYTSQKEYRWDGPSEAVGGGTYSRNDTDKTVFEPSKLNHQPHDPNLLPRNPDLPSQGADQDVHRRVAESSVPRAQVPPRDSGEEFPQRKSESGSRLSGIAYTESGNTTVENSTHQSDASEPPYWGSIRKAAGGGIYNTVTGHGSANDDHAQHHGLHQRDGIHNSVAGHGSNDVESQRHSFSQSGGEAMPIPRKADVGSRSAALGPTSTGNTRDASVPSSVASGALFAAPLPDIKEGQQKSFGPSGAENNTPAVTSAALHNTPAQTDALLTAPTSRNADHEVSWRNSVAQPKPEQRAFPLAPSHADERRRSGSRTRDTALGGAAGIGAGAAAYGIANKHMNNNQQVGPTPAEPTETRHSRSASEDHGHKASGGLFARKSRDEKRSASVDKHKKQLPSEEKRHSKVFGFLHRHKDDEPKEDTTTHEPGRVERKEEILEGSTSSSKTRNVLRKGSKNEGTRRSSSTHSDRSGHGKERLAAGAAVGAGAGALGLHHHKKEENLKDAARNEYGAEPTLAPRQWNQTEPPVAPNNNAQVAAGVGAGLAAGAGGYGMAKRNHQPAHHNTLPVTEEVPTPFEHPREPPMPPHIDAASGIGHVSQPTDTNVARTVLPDGAPAGQRHAEPSKYNVSTGGIVTQEPGQYNHLSTGTASGVKNDSAPLSDSTHSGHSKGAAAMGAAGLASGAAALKHNQSAHPSEAKTSDGGASDGYKHLPSGTASGVQRDTSSAETTAAHNTSSDYATSRPHNDRTDTGPYNKLPSGTPSGVKIKPKEHHPRQTSEPAVKAPTAATVIPPRHSIDANSSRNKDLPLPPSSSSPTDANSPIHHTILHAPETGRATNPPPPTQPAAHFTSFPNPGMVQNMSPEVMPGSYRQSVMPPRQEMSPEVMPDTYRQSVIPPHTTRQADGAERDVSPRESTTNDVVSSATAWQQQQHHHQQQSKQPTSVPSVSAFNPPPAPSSTLTQNNNNVLHQSKDRSSAVDPALAAATASWGVTGGLPTSNAGDKLMHKCEHCGSENDVTSVVRKEMDKLKGGSMMPSAGNSHGMWNRSK